MVLWLGQAHASRAEPRSRAALAPNSGPPGTLGPHSPFLQRTTHQPWLCIRHRLPVTGWALTLMGLSSSGLL